MKSRGLKLWSDTEDGAGRRRRKPPGLQKQIRADKGSRAGEEGETTGGTGLWKSSGRWDVLVWKLLWCCVQWRRSCEFNQHLEAWRAEGSDGKVFEEEVDAGGGSVPCTPHFLRISLSGRCRRCRRCRRRSKWPHASISGFWFWTKRETTTENLWDRFRGIWSDPRIID